MKKRILITLLSVVSLCAIVVIVALPFKQTQFLLLRISQYNRRNIETKLSECDAFVKNNPYFIPARLRYARLFLQLGYADPKNQDKHFNKAIEQYNILLKLDHKNVEAMKDLAQAYSTKKDFIEAERLYVNLTRLEPKSPSNYVMLATLSYAQGKKDKAKEELKKALSIDQKNGRAHLIYGILLEDNKDFSNAIIEYKNALAIFVSTKEEAQEIDVRLRLGNIYFKSGLYFDAVAQFEEIVKIRPKLIEGYLWLSDLYLRLGLFDKAINTLYSSLKISLRIPDAYRMLGAAHYKKQDYIASLSYYKKAEALGMNFNTKFLETLEKLAKEQQEKSKKRSND